MFLINSTQSIEPVQLWQFFIATACNSPKWFLYVFIGSRLASLSDGEQRHDMSTRTCFKLARMCAKLTKRLLQRQ
jgi:uncharacterized membrane protein YdjX (TVP38/TMEM64 family)